MPDVTTVSGSKFPVLDITHKPKRLQRDNILAAGTQYPEEESRDNQVSAMSCVPLHNITIERAIQYYESNATGEFATLYSNTAVWLRRLIAAGKSAVQKAALESEEPTNETKESEA